MNSSQRRLKALIIKEFIQAFRDPSSLLVAFALPLLLLFIFGYGVSTDAKKVSVGIAVEDNGEEARDLAASFQANSFFRTRLGKDRREFENDLVAGRLRGIIVIPRDFAQRVTKQAGPAKLQVITDGSETNTATYVQNYAEGVLRGWQAQRQAAYGQRKDPSVELIPRMWFNPAAESRLSLVPGSLGVIMAIIGTLLTALVVSREWERGTMESLMATPVKVSELILGKVIPYYVLGIMSVLLCALIGTTLFGVPFRGSLGALLLTSTAFLLAALGQGLLISTVAKNQFVASLAAIISGFLPAMFLSGFVFEINAMPLPVRALTRILAPRYFVTNVQTVFLAGDVWGLMLPNVAIMSALAGAIFTLIAKKSAKRLE
jgi:ABC-2 type transport system permease protein